MAKKKGEKSKDERLAEIAFAAGRALWFAPDDDAEVIQGPATALKKWKAELGGRKPEPSVYELARRQWIAAGRPPEGIFYGAFPTKEGMLGGNWFVFSPDGVWLQKESTVKNFKP